MSNFIGFLPVGAELFHANGHTDMKKQIFAFHNLTHDPKKIASVYKFEDGNSCDNYNCCNEHGKTCIISCVSFNLPIFETMW